MNYTKDFINNSNLLMEDVKSNKIELDQMYGQLFLIDSLSLSFGQGIGITIGNLLLFDISILGWQDSNLRMAESKSTALPLGDTPVLSNIIIGQEGIRTPDTVVRSHVL